MEDEKKTIEMLEDEIRSLLEELKVTQPTSEEYAKISEQLKVQYELLLKQEGMVKAERRETVRVVAEAGLGVLKFVGTLAFFGYNYSRGWKFEETGTLCSDTFKTARQDSRKMFKF